MCRKWSIYIGIKKIFNLVAIENLGCFAFTYILSGFRFLVNLKYIDKKPLPFILLLNTYFKYKEWQNRFLNKKFFFSCRLLVWQTLKKKKKKKKKYFLFTELENKKNKKKKKKKKKKHFHIFKVTRIPQQKNIAPPFL